MRETRSAAILAADAVGYSHAAETNEPLALQALSNSRRLIDPLIRAHGGRIFHTGGDSVLAEFARADEAVRCGVSLQRELRAAENAEALFGFRIGISFGEVVTDGDDLLGSTVNLAARLEAIAPAGGICISGPVHDAAGAMGEEWQDLGLRYLKNFSRPARIFRFAPPNASNLPVVAGARKPLVIVLPLARQGSRKDDDYFGEGVTEDVVAGLARFGRLAVLGTASSEAYRDRAVRLPELVAELGVDYVVGGSVRSAGDKVRLSVQLLDARSGLTLWAERYDRPLGDLFATQDEISATIVSTLAGQIEGETAAAAARKRTENMEAYDFLLRGIHQARDLDPKAAGAALKLFEQALALDPEYAAALAWFALMKLRLWAWHPEPAGGEAMFAAAKRALTLDPSDSWCHLVYGQIALYLGRFAEAEQH
ncbi:MAG: adenylate/guanylate cyclase domain-containing protein, partial [Rhizobiaceae bacterium]